MHRHSDIIVDALDDVVELVGHVLHAVRPGASEYVPTSQALHLPSGLVIVPKKPGLHLQSVIALLPKRMLALWGPCHVHKNVVMKKN